MNHGSLFSGGGGFDLAAEMAGWNNVFHCEKDPFCRTILNHYWPHATTYEDIRAFKGKKYKGKIDIITGGFPCQPFSAAGKRRGTADDRYLWPEMLRVIREIQPRWVVGENVYGLVSWDEGMVFHQVQLDLEAEGYEVGAYVLPASGINAPHQRYRVWFVAYNNEYGTSRRKKADTNTCSNGRFSTYFSGHATQRRDCREHIDTDGLRSVQLPQADADTYSQRQELAAEERTMERERPDKHSAGNYWHNWPVESPLRGRNDGLPTELDGITVSKWCNESLKMYGNAIVPQMALQLFESIKAYELL
ncbi:hypothetical protein CAP35_13665 [Chitinophagaceae bacterium IBVUCB1]|nr:hypothetical protein CAP35_13665 [Chitinophagaceae bacterium IBVUCB1]